MTVLDASAIIAFLKGEAGAEKVESGLAGSLCGAANWSEVAQKVTQAGGDWPLARELLFSYGVSVEPVTKADAEKAAALWKAGSGLSLGDRLCLALGGRLGQEILTADVAWACLPNVVLVR